jgi:hypothetical protein
MVVSKQNVCVARIEVNIINLLISVALALAFDFESRSPPDTPFLPLWVVKRQPRASPASLLGPLSPSALCGTDGLSAQTPIDMGIESIVIRERPRTKRTLADGDGSCHPRRSGPHPGVVQQWSLRDDAYGIAVTVAHIVNQRPAAASERPPRRGVLRWQETVARCTAPRVFDEFF